MEGHQRGVTIGSFLVVLVVMAAADQGSVQADLADLTISPKSQYCTLHPTLLSCDFKGTQEVVMLEPQYQRGSKTVNTVFVHNAEQVVAADVCVSFVGFNVANITYTTVPEACTPGQHFSFRLADSSSNLVPHYVTQLDLQGSAVKDIVLTRDLKAFSVVSSDIGHLEVSQPIKRLNMKIENSYINNLEKLHLEGRSYLVLYNVTINRMKKRSLYLKESTVNIYGSNIKMPLDEAVVLGYRSSVTLKDTEGRITLSGSEEMPPTNVPTPQTREERRPPGVPPQSIKPPPCNKPSILLWVIPMALAAVEAIVIIINCTNWFPGLKGRRVPNELEEGRGGVRQRPPEATSYYSTWYYNSEVPVMSPSRRQGMGFDKYK